jgi:hypothetical protein
MDSDCARALKGLAVKASFRLRRDLLETIHRDLSRPHAYAAERVGFLGCRLAAIPDGICIIGETYLPVADDHYEDDPSVGAMMGSAAIRSALEFAYNHKVSVFHLHRHEHRGPPGFSSVDEREAGRFIPDFWKVAPGLPHGALVLSRDRIHGKWWDPRSGRAQSIDKYITVGFPTTTHLEASHEGFE